jgi:hypothetical protein
MIREPDDAPYPEDPFYRALGPLPRPVMEDDEDLRKLLSFGIRGCASGLVLGDVVHDRARILARAVAAPTFTCAFGSGVAEDRAKAATTTGADMPTGKVASDSWAMC